MREICFKDSFKGLRLRVFGMLVILLIKIGKLEEGDVCGEEI